MAFWLFACLFIYSASPHPNTTCGVYKAIHFFHSWLQSNYVIFVYEGRTTAQWLRAGVLNGIYPRFNLGQEGEEILKFWIASSNGGNVKLHTLPGSLVIKQLPRVVSKYRTPPHKLDIILVAPLIFRLSFREL